MLVIDDTGDRKAGTHTDHVARQWLGSIGKVDNGIVAVSSLWADERVYYPLHVRPDTPAPRLPLGKKDASFRTKPQLAQELLEAAVAMGVPFRAVVADCAYGDNVNFEAGLWAAGLPYVVSLKPSRGRWAMADQAHTPRGGSTAAWPSAPRRLDAGRAALSERAHADLVRGRPDLQRLWAGATGAVGGRHNRPSHAAGDQDLVPDH